MKKLKILIVDDYYSNRLILSELMQMLGHESFQAENGSEAIIYLEKDKYDIVFMDIEMPVMNGIETAEYIRAKMFESHGNIKIIAITAHTPEYFKKYYKYELFDELLLKPYSLETIADLINNIV